MIQSTVRMVMPRQKRREALEILRSTSERVSVDPGCLSCRVYQDARETDVIMFEERWRSKEDLDQHLRSDDYRNVLLVAEMAIEAPEIRFEEIESSRGIEIIEEARKA
jgi:quinol monooxygenase YgiN